MAEQGAQLDTVVVLTRNMEDLARFYQDALGLGPYERSPGHVGCRLDAMYFGFDQVDDAEEDSVGRVTLWFTVDDLQGTFERLVAMGAPVRFAPADKPWGARIAAVYDPDGNLLGLAQRRPR